MEERTEVDLLSVKWVYRLRVDDQDHVTGEGDFRQCAKQSHSRLERFEGNGEDAMGDNG